MGWTQGLKQRCVLDSASQSSMGHSRGLEKTRIVGAEEGGKHLVQGLVWMDGEQQNCGSLSQRAEKQMNRMNR